VNLCEEAVDLPIDARPVLSYPRLSDLVKLVVEVSIAVLELHHYVNDDGSQVRHIVILVVAFDPADLTDVELSALSADLSQGKTMQRAGFVL
jgi:hypothetical protein